MHNIYEFIHGSCMQHPSGLFACVTFDLQPAHHTGTSRKEIKSACFAKNNVPGCSSSRYLFIVFNDTFHLLKNGMQFYLWVFQSVGQRKKTAQLFF